jgi:calcineurin-like phosphoesterase family protein
MRYYTSDLHLGHVRIIEYCKRPWPDVEAMTRGVIDGFNAVVGPTDEVVVVGDVCMGPKDKHAEYIKALNGHKILVFGNHDQRKAKGGRMETSEDTIARMLTLGFDEVYSELSFTDPQHGRIYVAHIPKQDHYHNFMICGHVHDDWARLGNIINVGVDVRNFTPITLDEAIATPDDVTPRKKEHRPMM